MARPFPALPHPSAAIVNSDGTIQREWFATLKEVIRRLPLVGSVTFAAATTATVTFDAPEQTADYFIDFDPPENKTFWASSKTTTGFTANASSSSSAAVLWKLTRR